MCDPSQKAESHHLHTVQLYISTQDSSLLDFLRTRRKIWANEGPGQQCIHFSHRTAQYCLSADGKKSPNRLSRISTQSAAHLHRCTEFHQPAEMTRFFLHRVSGALSVSKAVVLGQLGIILMLQARDSLNKLQGLWRRLLPVHVGIKSSVFGTKSFFTSDREKLTAPVQATSLLCYNEVNRSPRSLIDNSLRYKQASLRFVCRADQTKYTTTLLILKGFPLD